jgi:hypothetical protein
VDDREEGQHHQQSCQAGLQVRPSIVVIRSKYCIVKGIIDIVIDKHVC